VETTALHHQYPKLIGSSYSKRWLLTSYLSGEPITTATPVLLEKAATAIRSLIEQGVEETHINLYAKDDFLRLRKVSSEFTRRWQTLEANVEKLPLSCGCKKGLDTLLSRYKITHLALDVRVAFDFGRDLLENLNCRFSMSPSDFGFHNCLFDRKGNQLKMFDFEYAGLDNPLKLIMDFCFQPNFPISEWQADLFLSKLRIPGALEFSLLPEAAKRIFSVKWASIIMSRSFRNGEHLCSDKLMTNLQRFNLWS